MLRLEFPGAIYHVINRERWLEGSVGWKGQTLGFGVYKRALVVAPKPKV